jgi:hypothetical protein
MRTSSSIAKVPLQIPDNQPLSPCETPRAHRLHQLRAARGAIIRRLFQIPTEHERKAHEEQIARVRRALLRWI